jgi:type III secretion system FlhB-like substrate exporter
MFEGHNKYQTVNVDMEQKKQAYEIFGSEDESDEGNMDEDMIEEQEELELVERQPSMIDKIQELKQAILNSDIPENLYT